MLIEILFDNKVGRRNEYDYSDHWMINRVDDKDVIVNRFDKKTDFITQSLVQYSWYNKSC